MKRLLITALLIGLATSAQAKRISEYNTLASPASGDFFFISDTSDSGREFKVALSNLLSAIGAQASDADLTDLADGSLTGTKVGFADTDGLFTASNIQAAVEEFNDSINAGAPNGTGAKVHWSQLLGVPAGFADGTDDGSGGGYTNLTSFVAQTPWRIFYSNTDGDVTELALGADGTYLKSNGASAAPSWATPSGAAHDAVTLSTDLGNNLLGLSTQQLTLDSQTANYIFSAPNSSAGVPSFRAMVDGDIPSSIARDSELPTAASLSVDDLITLSGVATGAVNLGSFTGSSIADNLTIKAAFQDLESDLEALPTLTWGTGLTDTSSTISVTYPVSAEAFSGSGWDGDTGGLARNDAYDQLHLFDTNDNGAVDKIESGTAPTVDAAGKIGVDTTSDQLKYYGGAARVLSYKRQENFAVKTPVDADDFLIFKAQQAITITDIHVIAQGGTSISVDIQECNSSGASCATVDAAITADTDGAEDDGSLSNGTIDAGDWVKVVLGAPSGTVNYLAGSIYYTITAD